MEPKLKCILLVDDDEPTNFLNTTVINQMNCSETVVSMDSGLKALAYLTTKVEDQYPQPDLMFLDVNMPAMDGWQFLEAYEKLTEAQRSRLVVVMLNTSINPDDEEKAKSNPLVDGFENKPLTGEELKDIIRKYFPDL